MNDQLIYIVATNTFDGKIKMRHGEYLSTRKGGSGIGLSSMRMVAERYNGTMKAYHKDKTFFVDIMMRVAKE